MGQARSVAYSPDGEMIAVGLKNGEFMVLLANGLKVWGKRRDRAGSINDVRLVGVEDLFIWKYFSCIPDKKKIVMSKVLVRGRNSYLTLLLCVVVFLTLVV